MLFHAAMMHSGSELLWGKSNNARQEAFEAGKKLDKTFNSSDSKELLKVLQKASADDILKVSKNDFLKNMNKTITSVTHSFRTVKLKTH